MTDYFKQLFKQYQPKGILVDTNILLLLFVGTVNRDRISRFNRTEKFTPEDFDTLETILKTFRTRVTTPNILTEVNSFINQIGEPERSQYLNLFARNISGFNEQYLESQQVAKNPKFAKLGLTDCGITELAPQQYLVLTDDFRLANYLPQCGIDAINFNNLRPYGWT